VLGRYVREQRALSLMDALRKMTLAPAQRLEARVPSMAGKGRVRVGADADITIFDPADFLDRATYEKPHQYPTGKRTIVIVNGEVVVDSATHTGAMPGKVLRRKPDGAVS